MVKSVVELSPEVHKKVRKYMVEHDLSSIPKAVQSIVEEYFERR